MKNFVLYKYYSNKSDSDLDDSSPIDKMVQVWRELDFGKQSDLEKFLVSASLIVVYDQFVIPALDAYLFISDEETDRRVIQGIQAMMTGVRRTISEEDLEAMVQAGLILDEEVPKTHAQLFSSPLRATGSNILDLVSRKYSPTRKTFLLSLRDDISKEPHEREYPTIPWPEPTIVRKLVDAIRKISKLEEQPRPGARLAESVVESPHPPERQKKGRNRGPY